jgi:replicative DNA helicase
MTEDRTKGKERLNTLADTATEAEADPDRYHMEDAVLATLASDPFDQEDIAHAARTITWSRKEVGAIAAALIECVTEGTVPNIVIIKGKLRSAGAKVQDAVLAGIMDEKKAVDVTQARAYIEKLYALDGYRRAHAAGLEYLKAVEKAKQDGGKVKATFVKLVGDVLDIGQKRNLSADPPLASESLSALMNTLDKRRTSKRAGLDYGFPLLNDILSGLGPGLFVFGGITSCGKTSLMNQIADHVAKVEQIPVLFFAYEQGSEELLVKSLARLSAQDAWPGIDIGAIQKPWLADWRKVCKAETDYARGPGRFLRIIDAEAKHTVEEIRLLALMAKRREDRRRADVGTGEADAGKPSVLLVIDYLQIVPGVNPLTGRDFQSVRERVDFVLSALRRLSRELQAPILVLVSLNREGYDLPKDKTTFRLSGPPSLTVFKESGGIEYSADAAFCMGEDEVASREDVMHGGQPDRDRPEGRRVILFCMKNRNGRRVTLQADFFPAVALFRNVEKSALAEGRKDIIME